MIELDVKAQQAIEKVQKLLALAADKGATQGEAEAATAAAQRILEAYNIDMATVGSARKPGQRADAKRAGGLYRWQRELWYEIAKLNFCIHFSLKEWDPTKPSQYAKKKGYEQAGGWTFRHRVVGSRVNVLATENMADYLEGAINRLVKEQYGASGYFTTAANSFREGAVGTLSMRLQAKRDEILRAEKERAANAKTGNGRDLVLQSVIDAEKDANDDYLYGEGYSAQRRARQAAADAAYYERMAAKKAWAEANPEEAAAQKARDDAASAAWWAKEQKKQARRKTQPARSKQYKGDINAYYEGAEQAKNIGLDKQATYSEKKVLA